MICKNCEAIFDSRFCPSCGQKADIHRITVKHVLHDFMHAFTHADKGFLLLIKELFRRPGIVAHEYIDGKRKKYFNPLSFLVITAAVSAYVTGICGYYEALMTSRQQRTMHPMWVEVFQIANNNIKIFDLLLILPLVTIFCWLFFRKPKYTIAEHFVMNAFIFGLGNIIRVGVLVPLFLVAPNFIAYWQNLFQVTLLVYLMITYRQFFHQKIVWTILKTILIMVLYIITYWGVLFGWVFLKHLIA